MNMETIRKEYSRWLENCETIWPVDTDIPEELKAMEGDDAKIEDAFYRNLAFGTGGLRGVIGAGTNRMNVYTVAKVSQGLANYVIKNFPEEQRKIAVSYDSRIKSDLFARTAAGVFAANGIRVFLYPELMPTPCLSYAVRSLHCAAGIMITASHNPSKYNGYKVYGSDGCQITTEAAAEISEDIENLDVFHDVKTGSGELHIEKFYGKDREELCPEESYRANANVSEQMEACPGLISYIPDEVYTAFIEAVKKQSVLCGDETDRNVSIVYSPLNGTGLKPVLRALKESGFDNITVVAEQERPDGNFPTCPYPNPEIREAMALGMEYAARYGADLLLATDPDCDRVGIAVRNEDGDYVLLSGNETGMLLLDFICSQRIKHGKMPQDPVAVKTIVTTDMAERIAENYGVKMVNVLTGFKYIGEQIGLLSRQGKEDSYIFGFEESYGCLSGGYVRDKDAVGASLLVCEMFAYYKTRGISLLQKLDELYCAYGYTLNTLYSFTFEGSAGFRKMQDIMAAFRKGLEAIGPKQVFDTLDYSQGLDGLPKSNVLKFRLDGNCSVIIRPSGTEPKLKAYLSISAEGKETAAEMEQQVAEALKAALYSSARTGER